MSRSAVLNAAVIMAAIKALMIVVFLLMGTVFLIASIWNGLDGMQCLAGCACCAVATKGVV